MIQYVHGRHLVRVQFYSRSMCSRLTFNLFILPHTLSQYAIYRNRFANLKEYSENLKKQHNTTEIQVVLSSSLCVSVTGRREEKDETTTEKKKQDSISALHNSFVQRYRFIFFLILFYFIVALSSGDFIVIEFNPT